MIGPFRCLVVPLLFACSAGLAQENLPKFYTDFLQALISDSASLSRYVLSSEWKLSNRLGIQYRGSRNKFTISFDFDDEIKNGIRNGSLRSVVTLDSLGGESVKLNVDIPTKGMKKSFYFHSQKLVSPAFHFARQWKRETSEHFQFWISEPSQFHPEAIHELESFLKRAASLLQFGKADMQTLAREKLIYVLCRDEDEIERVTGYRTRGMYLMPYDYVVTTYSCHYHELLHQLINYKLRSLDQYTHPFLQEGFAVAFGGRGGIAPQTILSSGAFLNKSNFADHRELLAASAFLQQDASFTYPLSGLYVRFLFDQMGVQRFLKLYRTFSGTGDAMKKMILSENELPSAKLWEAFIDSVLRNPAIRLDEIHTSANILVKHEDVTISTVNEYYKIEMRPNICLVPPRIDTSYVSVKFKEVIPNRRYTGGRYLFTADSNEVVVYDLYTNNSIAGYSAGFSLPPQTVPVANGSYIFYVRKDVFPVEPVKFQVESFPK
jgi:hypothetical protein